VKIASPQPQAKHAKRFDLQVMKPVVVKKFLVEIWPATGKKPVVEKLCVRAWEYNQPAQLPPIDGNKSYRVGLQ
jgi:hypothetical protein